ncbi:MAG: hypothetical protein WC544_04775 [Patescibacteria group bacterium]
MSQLFLYEQTGAHHLAGMLEGMPVMAIADPSVALSYCYSPRQFSLIILELERLHLADSDRSAQELLFFSEVNLLYHGTPLIIVSSHPELFMPDLKRFGFERIVSLDFILGFLARKKEHVSLGEYATYAIGVPTPVSAARFRRLTETVILDHVLVSE